MNSEKDNSDAIVLFSIKNIPEWNQKSKKIKKRNLFFLPFMIFKNGFILNRIFIDKLNFIWHKTEMIWKEVGGFIFDFKCNKSHFDSCCVKLITNRMWASWWQIYKQKMIFCTRFCPPLLIHRTKNTFKI